MNFIKAGDQVLAFLPDRLGPEIAAKVPAMRVIAHPGQEPSEQRCRTIGRDKSGQNEYRMPVSTRRRSQERCGHGDRAKLHQGPHWLCQRQEQRWRRNPICLIIRHYLCFPSPERTCCLVF
jgi:hypothetical protein